jgi:transcription elongation GreA/GreB family factor
MAQIESEVARLEGELSRLQHSESDDDHHQIARVARDLRYWMARRSSAELVPPIADQTKVHFGSTVTIEREDGRCQTWRIVGEDEADPAHKTISYVSPLARALVNKKVGDVVEVNSMDVEVVAIA